MTISILRYLSVGLAVALADIAWGDTAYMFSSKDCPSTCPGVLTPSIEVYKVSSRTDDTIASQGATTASPADNILALKSRYDSLVREVARGYQLDSALLHAVISVESRYNPHALSPAGAGGLMQLMPATARRYGVENVLDPEQNLRGGAKYLRDLLSMFGSDLRLALAAYHAGEYAVAQHKNTIPPFQATIQFVSRVLDHYYRYRGTSPR